MSARQCISCHGCRQSESVPRRWHLVAIVGAEGLHAVSSIAEATGRPGFEDHIAAPGAEDGRPHLRVGRRLLTR
jgi:hypothetical protein